jgi:hypothetical protein
MIPNNVVLAAAVVPLREPDAVDVKVKLTSGVRPSHVQALLDDRVSTPTRSAAKVLLEEMDGEDVVVRVQATPEHAVDGAKLADEIIEALASVTGEHATTPRDAGHDSQAVTGDSAAHSHRGYDGSSQASSGYDREAGARRQ